MYSNSLPSVRWFLVSTIWASLLWRVTSDSFLHLFQRFNFLWVHKIVGLWFLLGHEIQRSTLQKFADLWDTEFLDTGLSTVTWWEDKKKFELSTYGNDCKYLIRYGHLGKNSRISRWQYLLRQVVACSKSLIRGKWFYRYTKYPNFEQIVNSMVRMSIGRMSNQDSEASIYWALGVEWKRPHQKRQFIVFQI